MYSSYSGNGQTGLGAWWAMIPAVVDAWGQVGGSRCWTGYNRKAETPCPDTPNYDAVYRAVQRAPDAEIQKIITYLLSANYGRGPKNRGDLLRRECLPNWVKAMLGGADCKASKFPEAPAYLRQFVQTYGAPETPAEEEPGSALAGIGTSMGGMGLALAALAAVFVFAPQLTKKRGR